MAAGVNPMALKRGIEKGVGAVVEELKRLSKPTRDKKKIQQAGTISANSDETIGKLISDKSGAVCSAERGLGSCFDADD